MSLLIRIFVLTVVVSLSCPNATTRQKQVAIQKVDKAPEKIKQTSLDRVKKSLHSVNSVNPLNTKMEKKNIKTVVKKQRSKTQLKKLVVVQEFPLDDIIYKGVASNKANRFIRTNTKIGKPLELAYEYTREQDLNDIEERIKRRFIEYSKLKR